MEIVKELNGITWATAELSGEGFWPEGIPIDEPNLVWVVEGESSPDRDLAGLAKVKGFFCIGNFCDDVFDRVKRNTELYVKAENFNEVMNLLNHFISRGDKVVFTGRNKEDFSKFVLELK